ncbi:hypothetical protein D0860_01943 [Hortaea werneckii]|uniref:F-box domain-containing protein n=1 Tax=Hortaea werneckii TaxID=91943 RepID=A0A3M7HNV0_HORWE|nr:hypothetical protein D0860_01943 [Hortaea werneckii]
MLTQTLPTLRTSHPTKSPPCSTHHHRPAATHANFPPTTPPSSLNSSSTPSTSDPRMPHLPPELWLQIFPPILSSREELMNLHLVCRAFHALLTRHEGSLDGRDEHAHEHEHGEGTKPHHQPVPPLSSSPPASSSAWRRTAGPPPFVSRAETTTPLSSSSPSTLPSALERHTTRLTHLHSLPPPALALLLFKLHTALRILRVLGPYPLRTTSTPSQHGRPWDSTTPQEIEMEEVWHDGNGAGLTSLFETELQSLNSRQQPFPDGTPKPPTLIACLRRTFADQTGVAFAETEGKMWEVLSSSEMGLDGDGHERMGSIIGREF